MKKKLGYATHLIHTGDGQYQKHLQTSSSVPETFPLYLTSVYAFDTVSDVEEVYTGKEGYIYSRISSPNSDNTAQIAAAADGAESALLFSSGMAAITSSFIALMREGDHILSSPVLYGGVRSFLENETPRFGVKVTFAPLDHDFEKHITPKTRFIYTETISNPLMEVPDLVYISKIAKKYGILFLVDNTFAPVIAKPLSLGADVLFYSATKYLGGHSDLVAGVVTSKESIISKIKPYQVLYGAAAGPLECWLLARSFRTLSLRMKKHSENAFALASYLNDHPRVDRVFYPGLATNRPSYRNAKKQFAKDLYGGMMSVNLYGGKANAISFIDKLKLFPFAPSLAGASTTVSYAPITSHRAYSKEERERAGITDNQVRISVGLEDIKDIISAIEEAL